MKKKSIALIGYRACGKTAIGLPLSKRLCLSFADTDEIVKEMEGNSISTIFSEKGENYFREIETLALKKALEAGGVISTGGGVILSEGNRKLIKKSSLVVFLTASEEDIVRRIERGGDRPNLTNLSLKDEVKQTLKERLPLYKSIADITLDTSRFSIGETLDKLVLFVEDKGLEI